MVLSSTNQQRERGAAALSLLTVGIIVALGIFAVMAVPLTNASDAKAKSRSAADAAALAGVDHIKLQLEDGLGALSGGGLPSLESLVPDGGLDQARQFAERNDGSLVSYTSPKPSNGWTATAVVRGRDASGVVNTSIASATLDFPSCSSREEEPPPPPPEEEPEEDEDEESDEDEEEEPPPPPPPPPNQILECSVGGTSLGIDLTEGDISLTTDFDNFVDDLLDAVGEPRLVRSEQSEGNVPPALL